MRYIGYVAAGLGLIALYLRFALRCARDEYSLQPDDLAAFIATCPLVEPRNARMISLGLKHYFDGDYISAIHLLTPQLEDVIRHILPRLGISTMSRQDNGERKKPLEVVLAADGEHTRLKEFIGEDLWTLLRAALIEKSGWNLRNQIAHGLASEEECSEVRAAGILLLLLAVVVKMPE